MCYTQPLGTSSGSAQKRMFKVIPFTTYCTLNKLFSLSLSHGTHFNVTQHHTHRTTWPHHQTTRRRLPFAGEGDVLNLATKVSPTVKCLLAESVTVRQWREKQPPASNFPRQHHHRLVRCWNFLFFLRRGKCSLQHIIFIWQHFFCFL